MIDNPWLTQKFISGRSFHPITPYHICQSPERFIESALPTSKRLNAPNCILAHTVCTIIFLPETWNLKAAPVLFTGKNWETLRLGVVSIFTHAWSQSPVGVGVTTLFTPEVWYWSHTVCWCKALPYRADNFPHTLAEDISLQWSNIPTARFYWKCLNLSILFLSSN